MHSTATKKQPRMERHLWDGLIPALGVALPMILGLLLDSRNLCPRVPIVP